MTQPIRRLAPSQNGSMHVCATRMGTGMNGALLFPIQPQTHQRRSQGRGHDPGVNGRAGRWYDGLYMTSSARGIPMGMHLILHAVTSMEHCCQGQLTASDSLCMVTSQQASKHEV